MAHWALGTRTLGPYTNGNAVMNAKADVGEGGFVESSGKEARMEWWLFSDRGREVRSRL